MPRTKSAKTPRLEGLKRAEEPQEQHRFGKKFELGNPYINSPDLVYTAPSDGTESYKKVFATKSKEIGMVLLERAREYAKDFQISAPENYPYLQEYENCLSIHIGTDGRWIDLSFDMFGAIASLHNLDSITEQILAFNLVSDFLEMLDPEILAPRISKELVVEYPLPNGLKLLPNDNNLLSDQKWLEKMSAIFKLGKFTSFEVKDDEQILTGENGRIVVRDGFCRAYDFPIFHIPRATYLVAKLVDSCAR